MLESLLAGAVAIIAGWVGRALYRRIVDDDPGAVEPDDPSEPPKPNGSPKRKRRQRGRF